MQLKKVFIHGFIQSRNTSPDIYHRQMIKRGQREYVMSRGELMEFNHCPHRWLEGVEPRDTDSTDWGTLIDCLLLQPETFDARYVIAPATYPSKGKGGVITEKPWNRNATYCSDWEELHIGKTVLKIKDHRAAEKAIAVIRQDKHIWELLECSQRSVYATADYLDNATGLIIPVKILVDLEPLKGHPEYGNGLGDFKTSLTAHPGPWPRCVFDRRYHVQAAFYLDVYNAATDEERDTWYHPMQENYAPFEPGRKILSQEFVELGRVKYREALVRYAQCLETGHWPGYDENTPRSYKGWSFTEPEPWMINK